MHISAAATVSGLFGIKWFLMALADGNQNDLAYEVLTTPTYPSYKWMMNNEIDNATTIWYVTLDALGGQPSIACLSDANLTDLPLSDRESWSFSDGTFSHNHPMYVPAVLPNTMDAAACILMIAHLLCLGNMIDWSRFASSEVWLIQSLGGIQPHPSAKGFDKVLIKPSPPTQLQHATTSYETVRGVIKTAWKKSGGAMHLDVTVPPNVIATVHVPSKYASATAFAPTPVVTESGRVLNGGRREDGSVVFEVGSGEYHFKSEY